MASTGSKPFFSFLTFAFLMAALVAGVQAIVQYQHPAAFGWPEQIASAQTGNWGTWVALGLGGLLGLICLLLGAYSMTQQRRLIGVTAILFGGAFSLAPYLTSPWTIYVAAGAFLLFIVTFMITDVLHRRAMNPKPAPSKKAG